MSTKDLNITKISPISKLRKLQSDWLIKVKILRRGTIDPYTNKKGSGEMWKLILIDDEGTKIQAVLFNDVITKFREILWYNKTYMISNGFVKAINPQYNNVNKEIELTLTLDSNVVEAESEVTMQGAYDFIPFNEVALHCEDKKLFDVIGFVTNVKPIYIINKDNNNVISKMRQVVMKNMRQEILQLTLWGDLAENEGSILEKLVAEKPIITLSNVKVSVYQGEFSITTLSVTSIQINPELEQTKEMKAWLESYLDEAGADQFHSPIRRIKKAPEVTMQNIVKGDLPKPEGLYYYFIAVVKDILNKDDIFYEACKGCNKKVEIIDGEARCSDCQTNYAEYGRKYRVKLLVVDEQDCAEVTLFDEAHVLTGCPAMQFPQQQKKYQSKFYRNLISSIGKKYKFLIRLSKSKENDRKMGKMVAEEIEEIEEIGDSDTETTEKEESIQSLKKKTKKGGRS